MSELRFEEVFERATGNRAFPYQASWATSAALPSLVSVPTGMGKTAGAILSWVWRRHFAPPPVKSATPRRLIYCLPMRVLVEQTRDCALGWLRQLLLLAERAPAEHAEHEVAVHVLMGGDLEADWDRWPDRDQILIGTQDMLLSRALNRGYAMSRFRWPVQFALLNNDAWWVMDEVQLMGNGLATTAQLQAFRRKLGTTLPVQSTWMSATMRSQWLETVDVELPLDAPGELTLSKADRDVAAVARRFAAEKPLAEAPMLATKDGKAEATWLLGEHTPQSRSLFVVNTVNRAQAIFEALRKLKPAAELVLLHSRFREQDRDAALKRLLADPGPQGTICVSTQVVEAGVDVSARLLATDLAPWSSLVQRFGRCNRKGELTDAKVVWFRPDSLDDEKKLKAAPYLPDELRAAFEKLRNLEDVGPRSLPEVDEEMSFTHVVRRKDIIELFDTTPDLAGADIDVSRFIREADEHHVQVFWRDVEGKAPADDEPGPRREELCGVGVGELNGWLKKHDGWRFDHLEKRWERVTRAFPGWVILLRARDGGYDAQMGWTGKPGSVSSLTAGPPEEDNDSDALSANRSWQTVADHTNRVVAAVESLLSSVTGLDDDSNHSALRDAARWHDCGKAHAVFQGALPEDRPGGILAKSAAPMKRYERPGFRHELASALAMLGCGKSDLAAYLAAAHHGKVRLSIRSLPIEQPPRETPEARFARGIVDGDVVPIVDLGGGIVMPDTALKLSYMDLGEDEQTGPSWLERMLRLRDAPSLGPFRLALLEAVLRVADWRASSEKEVM